MKFFKKMRFLFLGLPLFFALAACGAPEINSEGTVQDIQPGDQSVIQPPAATQPVQDNRLEERNI